MVSVKLLHKNITYAKKKKKLIDIIFFLKTLKALQFRLVIIFLKKSTKMTD